MGNQYFQFKQFTVHQEKCAMKVTTDGCLFGAIAAASQKSAVTTASKVLDIGTGTGLLALMYAQQNLAADIDAVEIDTAAAAQATENFAQSPWKDRLTAIRTRIQEFNPGYQYDTIISNPPFYEKQLASGNLSKDTAHHSSGLTLEELLASVKRLLQPTGVFVVLMPYYREEETIRLATLQHLHLTEIVRLRQTPAHQYFRSILFFNCEKTRLPIEQEIVIKETDGNYSQAFKALLAAYYLHL